MVRFKGKRGNTSGTGELLLVTGRVGGDTVRNLDRLKSK